LKIVISETKSHMTLTSDDLESHIIVNVSSTLTNTTISVCGCIEFDCGCTDARTDVRTYVWVDGRTYRQTDIFTGFITSSLRR